MQRKIIGILRCPYDGTRISDNLECEKGHKFSEEEFFINMLIEPIEKTGLDVLSPIYENLWAPIGFYITSHNSYVKTLGDVATHVSGNLVADLGTGSGKIFDFMKCNICIGIDRSESYLRTLKSKRPHVIGIRADLSKGIPLEDNVTDGISMTFFLHMLKDKELIVKESYRVLKDGGKMGAIILTNNNPISRFLGRVWNLELKPISYYTQLFRNEGFEINEVRIMGAWSMILTRKK